MLLPIGRNSHGPIKHQVEQRRLLALAPFFKYRSFAGRRFWLATQLRFFTAIFVCDENRNSLAIVPVFNQGSNFFVCVIFPFPERRHGIGKYGKAGVPQRRAQSNWCPSLLFVEAAKA